MNEPIEPVFPEMEIETKLKSELEGFIKRDFLQRDRIAKQTDGDYYFVTVFQNSEQRNKFLKALQLAPLLQDGLFLNGLKASEKLGIEQERIMLKRAKFRKNFNANYI